MSAPRAWAELLRLPALFTVPGDALAGAATTGLRPNPRTLLAVGSSLCLYEAGMALNDWADRADDAVERPERPLPSGRIAPPAALAAATAFTAAGLTLAARAGRPSLVTAGALAGTVWAYDLGLKHTPAGPVAMAAARGLDLLLGATATAGPTLARTAESAVPSAAALAAHTLAVTVVSRREAQGGSSIAPLAALTVTAALTRLVAVGRRGGTVALVSSSGDGSRRGSGAGSGSAAGSGSRAGSGSGDGSWVGDGGSRWGGGVGVVGEVGWDGVTERGGGRGGQGGSVGSVGQNGQVGRVGQVDQVGRMGRMGQVGRVGHVVGRLGRGNRYSHADTATATATVQPTSAALRTARLSLRGALALAYFGTAAKPLFHAVLNPSPPLTQRAVGGGIRAMIPLQAALTARAGAAGTALLTAALAPAARKFARKVSVT